MSSKPAKPSAHSPAPMKGRILFLMFCTLSIASAVIARAAWIQLRADPRLAHMAKRQFQSKVLIQPRRGAILDQAGEPLAINAEINSLAANPKKVENPRTLARLLSRITALPASKLLERLRDKKDFVWIKRHLSDADLEKLKDSKIIGPSGELPPGFWLVKESKRIYPHRELAAHVLGDVNIDQEGMEGVELKLNDKLRGKVISVAAVRDARGRPSFIDAQAAKDVEDGQNLTLTIDASLQFAVEEHLRNAVQKHGAKSGSVLVMNSENGEILALANEPTFNPNAKGASPDRRRNRLLTDGYEPGSTLKSILVASALSHGWKINDLIWGEKGSFVVQGRRISEAESDEKFEWLSLKKLIQVSSNVGAAKLALKLGAEHYHSTLSALEFGKKSELGFPGEISGKLPPKKFWQPLTLANIGFGQGLLTTRLQVARAYAALANGGWLVQPKLVKAIGATSQASVTPKRIFSQQVTEKVTLALEEVTGLEGTGKKAALPGYRVAGKTGTAQMVDPVTKRYSRSKFISSFVGYPVAADPKVVILTSLEEPKGIYYASETAAPLFRDVLNAVVTRYSVPSQMPLSTARRLLASNTDTTVERLKISQAKTIEAMPSAPSKGKLQWQSVDARGESTWSMPSLVGLTGREATKALLGHRFKLEIVGSGIVETQHPAPGEPIADHDSVKISLKEPE